MGRWIKAGIDSYPSRPSRQTWQLQQAQALSGVDIHMVKVDVDTQSWHSCASARHGPFMFL